MLLYLLVCGCVCVCVVCCVLCVCVCFFQGEDGKRDRVRSRGHGDVYKRQADGLYPMEYRSIRSPTPESSLGLFLLHI